MFGGCLVVSDFYGSFLVFKEIFSGSPASSRPQCSPPITMETPNSTFTSTSARNNLDPVTPNCRGFKMASLKITNLLKHIDELRIILNDQCVDVLAINEKRLDENISGGPGYKSSRVTILSVSGLLTVDIVAEYAFTFVQT